MIISPGFNIASISKLKRNVINLIIFFQRRRKFTSNYNISLIHKIRNYPGFLSNVKKVVMAFALLGTNKRYGNWHKHIITLTESRRDTGNAI